MDENKDFVIDIGMPVTSSTPENPTLDSQTVGNSSLEDAALVVEDPVIGDVTDDSLTSEPDAVPEDEEIIPPSEDNGPTLADIASLIEGLQKQFDEKIAVDEHKNGLFDKLYKERDEYKNDFYGRLLKPFITGCIEIINDLRSYTSKMDAYDVERSLNYLRSLPDDLVELLENNGVELYAEESEVFNPRTQRAKKIVPTEDASLNNTVAERLEKGYSWNGVVLRPEMVAVYRFK